MSPRSAQKALGLSVVCMFVLAAPCIVRAEAFIGEVTGTSSQVHVRSGPSTNFYPVLRLSPGDRVNVVGEESGWYAIEPPPGCFSLISKHYVDVGANGEGVVNGNAVRVRAGSDLDEHRYAVQCKLDKGATVKILGEEDEGFLKIAAPPGARLWIHGDYVVRVPADRLAAGSGAAGSESPPATKPAAAPSEGQAKEAQAASEPQAVQKPETPDKREKPAEPVIKNRGAEELVSPRATLETPVDFAAITPPQTFDTDPIAESAPAAGTSTPEAGIETSAPALTMSVREEMAPAAGSDGETAPADSALSAEHNAGGQVVEKYRRQLAELDERFDSEMAKPIEDRNLQEIGEAYAALAGQSEDRLVQLYAERRQAQVDLAITTSEAIRDLRSLSDDVARERSMALESRAQLRPPPVRMVVRGFDAKGELRESLIFGQTFGPKRYRLVDPDRSVPRTLCYIEIPEELEIDINNFIGRLVGVRATRQFLETGNVDPIPVVVAEELVVLDRKQLDAAPVESRALESRPGESRPVVSRAQAAPPVEKIGVATLIEDGRKDAVATIDHEVAD